MPYVAATAFALAPATHLSAADPSQVKAIIDQVRATGTVFDYHGLNIREITLTSEQIGYTGNYDITFSVPDDKKSISLGLEYLVIRLIDLSTNQEIAMTDGSAVLPPQGSVDGILDAFERTRKNADGRKVLANANGRDAQVLGQTIWDRVVSLYYRFINR